MDNIFTLIVIIIAVVSVIGKMQAQQKKGAEPSDSGGLIAKLSTFFTDIQRKIDEQSKGSTTGSSPWSQLSGGSQTDTHDDTLEDLVLDEEQAHPLPEKMPPPQPVGARRKRFEKKQILPDAPPRPALRTAKSTYSIVNTNRAELRRAVVWREILGPPVALRDQLSDRR